MQIGEKIKRIRKASSLTQKEFARPLGVRGSYISMVEKGVNPPSDTLIALIKKEYSVSEHWWDTGEGAVFDTQRRTEDQDAAIREVTYVIEKMKEIPKSKRMQLAGRIMEMVEEYLAEEEKKDGNGNGQE